MPGIQMRAPDGRRWTLKEVVQGKPLGHPSHVMFVHFPIAFYIAVLAFDIMSRVGDFADSAPLAATWLIVGAGAASIAAVITGFVDYFQMVKGSTRRKVATRHFLFQFAAFGFFVVNFALRWNDRYLKDAKISWIVLEALGVLAITVGQYLGGVLVYEYGMRVKTAERAEATASQPMA